MSEDMKTMKAPKLEIRAETRYVVRVGGREMRARFRQTNEMCGMKQLVDERGRVMVVDVPDALMDVLSKVLGRDDEYIKVSLIKASDEVTNEIRTLIAEAKAELDEPVRQPVRKTEVTEGKVSKGGVNKAPTTPPPSEPPAGQGGAQSE